MYNVFVSHSWDNSEDLKNLKSLLEEKKYFKVEFKEVTKDEPINSNNSTYIKRVLSDKIKNADIVIGLAGLYASHSDWMEWELDKALEHETPIIGVIPWGQQRVSTMVTSRSIEDVRWNTDSIVNAIRNHSK